MKHEFKFLAIIVSIFLIGVFLQGKIDSSKSNISESLGETFEIISELFSVFVALSIFAITWHAYSRSWDRHSLFLGATFLITGFLILFHLLSYPFMPDFINPNSAHKAAIFFLESRFILAVLILASVFVHKDSRPELINKRVMVLFMIAIVTIFMVSVFFHNDSLFVAYNLDTHSTETVNLLFVITIIILVACYLYAKRAKETGQNNLHFLIYGSFVVLLSNLVYFFYEFSGHFLIITGFFFFYLGLYKSSVELPYEKLAIAEEKIRIGAENKYRNLFDNANDAIVTTDIQDCVTSWNRSAEKLFGWEAKGVMGKKLSDLFLLGQSASGIETVHIHETGNKIFVSLTISQLLDSDDKLTGLSFVIHDITERKKAEDLLIKSKEFTETVINSMNDAISVIDVNNFRIIEANSVFLDNYGMKKEEVIGKTCYEITHKRTKPCTPPDDICPLIETLKTGKNSTSEHVHYIQSGEKRYVETSISPIIEANGKVDKVIHVSRDITKRKQTEEALNKSRNLLDTIKSVQDNFIVDSDIKVTFNDILSNVLSLTQSEYGFIGEILYTAKGDPFLKIHAFTNIAWNKEIQEFYEKNAPKGIEFYDLNTLFGSVITGEKPVIANDPSTDARRGGLPEGHPQIYKFLGIPFYHGGKLNGMIGVANRPEGYNEDIIEYLKPLLNTCANIIEAYRIDQRRKLAEKQIEVSLQEKETLLKEIHHRVKNNMQIISSLLLLQSQNIIDQKYLDIFNDSNNRILSMSLIHEKLYQSENLAQINIQGYINDLASNLMAAYGGKGNAELEINVENIPLNINYAVPCGLILNELITNSLKYAFPEDRHGKIKIVFQKKDGNMIHFSVSDDGIGISRDMDIRNTKSLGMHLINALAENQLHGEIILNRERGTEFQINFKGE